MLKINLEFRKGILFVRLNGNLTKEKSLYQIKNLVGDIGIKYIVFNIDNIKRIDINGINFILDYNELLKNNNSILLLCESDNLITNKIFKNKIPYIKNEIEAFNLI